MELIPKQPEEENVYEKYPALDGMLSDIAQGTRSINRLPRKSYDKQRFLQAIHEAFELVGGVPRLAIWADQNYGDFVKVVGKTLPAVLQQVNIHNPGLVKIVSAIPPSPLDGEWTEGEFTEGPSDAKDKTSGT